MANRKSMAAIRKVIVFDTKEELVEFARKLWFEIFAASIAEKGLMTAALSGGHTPVDFYEALAGSADYIEWEKVHIFLVDERFVPPTDEDSNYAMIRRTLGDNVPLPAGNLHPVRTVGITPDQAADAYEQEIIRNFNLKKGELPRFDLIMLGLGEDGHTASLFPGNPGFLETVRYVQAVKPGRGASHDRITLTLPVIDNARCAVFLVSGEGKAEALKRTVEEKDPELPAAHVSPQEGTLLFLVEMKAASLLSKETYATAER